MKDTSKLLQDRLVAITTIESYAVPSYAVFIKDEKTQDAIMFNLVIMGEAASNISRDFQEKHSEIPWSSIIAKARNVIVQGYDQVKLQIVWDIIQKNLNPLKLALIELLGSF
jgi:uncharacterized protein with HEPN domain